MITETFLTHPLTVGTEVSSGEVVDFGESIRQGCPGLLVVAPSRAGKSRFVNSLYTQVTDLEPGVYSSALFIDPKGPRGVTQLVDNVGSTGLQVGEALVAIVAIALGAEIQAIENGLAGRRLVVVDGFDYLVHLSEVVEQRLEVLVTLAETRPNVLVVATAQRAKPTFLKTMDRLEISEGDDGVGKLSTLVGSSTVVVDTK